MRNKNNFFVEHPQEHMLSENMGEIAFKLFYLMKKCLLFWKMVTQSHLVYFNSPKNFQKESKNFNLIKIRYIRLITA